MSADQEAPGFQTMHMGARNGLPERKPYVYQGTGRDENPATNPSLGQVYRGGVRGVRRMPRTDERVTDGATGRESEQVSVLMDANYTDRLLFGRCSREEARMWSCGSGQHQCGGDEEGHLVQDGPEVVRVDYATERHVVQSGQGARSAGQYRGADPRETEPTSGVAAPSTAAPQDSTTDGLNAAGRLARHHRKAARHDSTTGHRLPTEDAAPPAGLSTIRCGSCGYLSSHPSHKLVCG